MVVLKNISEKPEECRGCRFHDKEGDCYLLPESRSYETYAEQYEHCPIEESPQVIRCRDCGWWEKQADSLQGRCSLLEIYPTGSWYCANAIRVIYPCDPEKNAKCKKTDCYINGGPCNKTTRKECRIEELLSDRQKGGCMDIINRIGAATALEQLAEECTELAQAALKMARCLRGENPVAGSMDEMTDHIHEEIADVQNVLSILEGTYLYDPHRVARIMEKKMRRWRRRLSRWRRYDS